MLRWPPLTGTQLSPVAPRSWFFPAATLRATAMTGGLNQVRISGVVCVFIPGTSDPFPLSFPLSPPPCPTSPLPSPLPSPLLFLLLTLLSPFFPPLLFSFFFPSPFLLTLPSSLTVENVLRRGRHAIT
ncbi:unnamed protein product [Schistocephalus solidus]|uniref:Uncharacterized protein n=1 Tax=Schistocephalus solidus TaxID=70667 RepID=A0A183T4I2_SCHSO|nr:unnamed protein product [Schistocephalus solidus]